MLARVQLGRAFSVQAKATTLVTTGLYSRIRNPIYVFGALMVAGIIIFTGSYWLLLFLVVLCLCRFGEAGKRNRYWMRSSARLTLNTSERPGSDPTRTNYQSNSIRSGCSIRKKQCILSGLASFSALWS